MCGGPPPYASSAMRPTAHTQQASSRAVATFALLPWTPRASSASRLSRPSRNCPHQCSQSTPGPGVHGTDPLRDGAGVVAEGRGTYLPGHDVEGDCLYRAGVDVEADEGGSIEHGSPFHECGVAATVGLDTHHCRPNPRSFMQQGLSMFLCPAHIVCAGSLGHSLLQEAGVRQPILVAVKKSPRSWLRTGRFVFWAYAASLMQSGRRAPGARRSS